MALYTDYAENKIADFWRGQGLTLPANWYIGLGKTVGSPVEDGTMLELTTTGYARQSYTRSLGNWDNTQADATTAASSGTSHTTRNTNAISFGSPSGSVQIATHVGLFDASTSGNAWVWIEIGETHVGASAAITIAAGALEVIVGKAGSGVSDYLANKWVDKFFRAQTFNCPATFYLAAYTALPTTAGGGTEVSAVDYARASLVPSLANISGTQSAGSTIASSGTGGAISNNAAVDYVAPSSSWGTVVGEGVRDAATLGNLLWFGSITPKTIGAGAPLRHPAASITLTIA
jgi:hypothetical protein